MDHNTCSQCGHLSHQHHPCGCVDFQAEYVKAFIWGHSDEALQQYGLAAWIYFGFLAVGCFIVFLTRL